MSQKAKNLKKIFETASFE